MHLNQVLVIYKQVTDNPLHLAALDELYGALKDLGISFDAQSIGQLTNVGDVDLVITVGGDGTVLAASHFIKNQPVLGLKSFGKQSVGHFCAATKKTIRKYLKEVIGGHRRPIKLHRLQVRINGQRVAESVLNDVLFASSNPASTSRYKLFAAGRREEHKSSGVWVSTAAGSTAAMKAAGGKKLPLTSDKIEYLVREPYPSRAHYVLTKGILPSNARVKIISQTSQGTVFIDGGGAQYPAPTGSTITIGNGNRPLSVYWR